MFFIPLFLLASISCCFAADDDATLKQLVTILNSESDPTISNDSIQTLITSINPDNINTKPYHNGYTLLHYAAESKSPYAPLVVQQLLQLPHINANATTRTGRAPLHGVVQSDSPYASEILSQLLSHANISANIQDCEGITPVRLAVHYNTKIFKQLLDNPNIDKQFIDKYTGDTLLHEIVKRTIFESDPKEECIKQLEFLIEYMQVNTANNSGKNLLHVLIEQLNFIIQYSPQSKLIYQGKLSPHMQNLITFLIDAGANPNQHNNANNTPNDCLQKSEYISSDLKTEIASLFNTQS